MHKCCFSRKQHVAEDKQFSKVYIKNSKADSFESMLKISKLYNFDVQTNLNLLQAIYDAVVQDPLLNSYIIPRLDFKHVSTESPVKIIDNMLFNKYEYKIMTMVKIEDLKVDEFSRYCDIVKMCLENVPKFEKKDVESLINKIIIFKKLRS